MARKCAREINGSIVWPDRISNLDTVLGIKWNERILNTNGDFAYVYRQKVSFWLVEKKQSLNINILETASLSQQSKMIPF